MQQHPTSHHAHKNEKKITNLFKRNLFPTIGLALISVSLVAIFLITKSGTPSVSELSFVEHSILGKDAGSVVPASCNSAPPTSHFQNDCLAACPYPMQSYSYDPYFDPGHTACPAAPTPSVQLYFSH